MKESLRKLSVVLWRAPSRGQLSSLSRLQIFAACLGLSEKVRKNTTYVCNGNTGMLNGIAVEGRFGLPSWLEQPCPQGSRIFGLISFRVLIR